MYGLMGLVKYDTFMRGIYEGHQYADVEYELKEMGADGTPILRKYKGVWLMVDNGYLSWPTTTVSPIKSPATYNDLRWSKWLESLRKDVACTFGILKGR